MRLAKFLTLLLLFTAYNYLFSQIKLEKEEIKGKTYILSCFLDTTNIKIIDNRLTYSDYDNPGEEGTIAFPVFDLYIAIPENSNPTVDLIPKTIRSYPALPSINSKAVLADSVVRYTEYKGKIRILNSSWQIKKMGFLSLENRFCIHLKLFLFRMSDVDLKSEVLTKFNLSLNFENAIPASLSLKTGRSGVVLNNYDAANIQGKNSKQLLNDKWIDYTKDYLKLGISNTGVYRLSYDDLVNIVPAIKGVNPKTFKIFSNGVQIPIYVNGEQDNSFDRSDYVEFIGLRNLEKNYRETSKKGEAYKEYVNRYTDTTIYWLTWNGENGKRVSSFNEINKAVADTISFYHENLHIENNTWFDFSSPNLVQRENPSWNDNKTWHEGNLGVGTRSVSFNTSDVFPNDAAYVYSKLQDYASDIEIKPHQLAIGLNNEPAQDTISLNKYDQAVLKGKYNSKLLTPGNNNLKIYSYKTSASINTCIMDWYELEYPRYIKPFSDSLIFQFPYLPGAAPHNVKIIGLNNSKKYVLWKKDNSFARKIFSSANSKYVFKDSITSQSCYILADSAKALKPRIYYQKKFENIVLKNSSSKYLLLTHKNFISKGNEYSSFISKQYNLTATVTDVNDVYDLYSYGFFNPEAIKMYFDDLYKTGKALRYIFIVGAATYDYLGNMSKFQSVPKAYNYVPSYGAPLSDSWFVMFDSTNSFIPQISIGRLPAKSVEEFNNYFQRHVDFVNNKNNFWNKRYLFFSGGAGNDINQINTLKGINDYIIDNFVKPAPVGGNASHFYKTINPSTNFGPYTNSQIQTAIDSGAVFISYLGHSGTQTWDNTITDPAQLKNKVNRSSLITDFGCSTARYGEPDITSFSQLFVSDKNGTAIGYIGNASIGFTSTSYVFPKIFYKKILADSVTTIGDAHRLAKIELLKTYGASGAYSLFALTNTLIGDPIIKLQVPQKPDLSINPSGIKPASSSYSDSDDSAIVKINYYNIGSVINSKFRISISCLQNGANIFSKVVERDIPSFLDSVRISIPVKGVPGNYNVRVILDDKNVINELNESNNQSEIFFNVISQALRNLNPYTVEGEIPAIIKFLNPHVKSPANSFDLELSDNPLFSNLVKMRIPFDTVITKFQVDKKYLNRRIWVKSNLDNNNQKVFSAKVTGRLAYALNDSLDFETGNKVDVAIRNNNLELSKKKNVLETLSAGFNDGNTALIKVNNQNLIPENTLRGHHVALLKDSTFEFIKYYRFDVLSGGEEITKYISFLDSLTSKYIVAIAVSDEGSIGSAELKSKIKSIGSKYVDSLGWRGSWTIIGKKGALPGSVPEAFSKAFKGRVTTSALSETIARNGIYISSKIGPAVKWNSASFNSNLPDSLIKVDLIGFTSAEKTDTIKNLPKKNYLVDLTKIDSGKYSYIKLRLNFNSVRNERISVLNNLNVSYKSLPELLTNYQAVSINKDTLEQGENAAIKFSVYNAGESSASNFKVAVDLVKKDNAREKIFAQAVDSLKADSKKTFMVNYNTSGVNGSLHFEIRIDGDNVIKEYFKDNNIYALPIFIKSNQKPATLKISLAGKEIMDGDFISSNPNFKIELHDESLIPINDTGKVMIYLNGKQVYYSGNDNSLSVRYSLNNPKMIVDYSPVLKDGEYTLKVIGKNATDKIIDSSGTVKRFSVKNELQLLNVFNYPNPFGDETYFTFKLTQVPDELKIIVFTIAGRKVKEIKLHGSELNYDFNRVYWDGKDEDGDKLSNGTYLYKIISKKGNEDIQATEKLSIIR